MKTVFEAYSQLWPESRRKSLQPLLSRVYVLRYPDDREAMNKVLNRASVLIVVREAEVHQLMDLLSLGFEHCIQESRPDFAAELLVSSLMAFRPKAFTQNPIPFFFNGFQEVTADSTQMDQSMVLPFRSNAEKAKLLQELEAFLAQSPRLQALTDLCLQVADELMSNALFSAPVDPQSGARLYQNVPRTSVVVYDGARTSSLFAGFSDHRVIIGCEDPFGSFHRSNLFMHLRASSDTTVTPKMQTAGAGIGFKSLIDNAANFYLYCDQGQKSLVACGFLLSGLKRNLSQQKHIHLSLR